ncbi:MAG: hypothetical protein IJ111_03555 [Eggerthellaceae bacterium]|nr:hypothetical protein [Eggerthellaceae bacterium]
MAKQGSRKDDADLALRPEPPAKRKKVSRLKITGMGVAARITAVLAAVCMLFPWLHAPGINVLAEFSWMFGLYIQQGDFLFPMFGTGEMAEFLDAISGAGWYSPVWAVFLILWGAALLLLVVRFFQSVLGLRDSRRLIISGFFAGGVAIAWAIAVLLLNAQYMSLFEDAFGLVFTVFEIPPAVFLTAVFGIASGILARQDKHQPFISQ